MKVLQICAYAAPYEGNFMKSLYALEKRMAEYGYETIYAFPEQVGNYQWCQNLSADHKVYYLPVSKASFRIKTYCIIRRIFRSCRDIAIAHSHFECYDVPLSIVSPRSVSVFWHLHDPITIGTGVRKLLRWLHYRVFSKNVHLISVAEKYRKDIVNLGFNEANTRTVLNGIDLQRIDDSQSGDKKVDFITFGWNFHIKGVDIILDACDILSQEGIRFSIIVNGNDSTLGKVRKHYPNGLPECISFRGFCENVNELFGTANCFIQASRAETFSYGVAEAAYAGLNVICSDVYGLEWAHEIPSVIFFESEDVNGLALSMKSILKREQNPEIIARSKTVIMQKYSVGCWVNKIINSYFGRNE